MLNYSIGGFFGILLTFGIMMFFSLVWIKGIFMIVSRFGDRNIIHHYHHHQATYHHRDRSKSL